MNKRQSIRCDIDLFKPWLAKSTRFPEQKVIETWIDECLFIAQLRWLKVTHHESVTRKLEKQGQDVQWHC